MTWKFIGNMTVLMLESIFLARAFVHLGIHYQLIQILLGSLQSPYKDVTWLNSCDRVFWLHSVSIDFIWWFLWWFYLFVLYFWRLMAVGILSHFICFLVFCLRNIISVHQTGPDVPWPDRLCVMCIATVNCGQWPKTK